MPASNNRVKRAPRRPSPLQRDILVVLAAHNARLSEPLRSRDLEDMLAAGRDRPVYGPSLRDSCRRMEAAGWLRRLRASNQQLALELTNVGREMAVPLLVAEQQAEIARQRAAEVHVLPIRPEERERLEHDVTLDGTVYHAWRGDFVVRLDGSTCLQLWHANGHRTVIEGDALQVAMAYQACHDAGMPVQVQVNHTPPYGHTGRE
ncbi:hypothetical protein ACIPTP_22175 [Pectobacterium versatile]|uniref:hypothetical protein n=1 Tax=Pectobacterium versatile TaxID=2488639 RepID=UPI0037FB06CB